MSCGAELTHGPAHEGPPPPIPTRPFWSRINPASGGACVLGLAGGLAFLGAVGVFVMAVWLFVAIGKHGSEAAVALPFVLILWAVAVVLAGVGLNLLVASLVAVVRARRR
jgi:hypothetical protein